MKNDRLFQMLYLLLEKGRMTAPALSEKLEISIRTVYRDVETLAMAGIPILATAGKGGGISLMPGFTFDKSILSKGERDKLLFALQSLRAADQEVDELLHKLGVAFHHSYADWIVVDFSRWGFSHIDTQRFELLKTAILNCQILNLTYYGASGEKSHRLVHPLRLVYKGKSWYLQAYCQGAEDFRLFKMGRIWAVAPTEETFAHDYSPYIPPIESETPFGVETNILLRFSPKIAFRVYEEFERSAILEESNGFLSVELSFPIDGWVISYLFSFGTEVKILSPVNLRQEVAEYAEKISAHHRT